MLRVTGTSDVPQAPPLPLPDTTSSGKDTTVAREGTPLGTKIFSFSLTEIEKETLLENNLPNNLR